MTMMTAGPEQVEQHSQDMGMAAGALRSMTEEKVALEKRLHRLERQVLLAQACMYPCLFAPCALRVRSVCSHPEANWHIMWGRGTGRVLHAERLMPHGSKQHSMPTERQWTSAFRRSDRPTWNACASSNCSGSASETRRV